MFRYCRGRGARGRGREGISVVVWPLCLLCCSLLKFWVFLSAAKSACAGRSDMKSVYAAAQSTCISCCCILYFCHVAPLCFCWLSTIRVDKLYPYMRKSSVIRRTLCHTEQFCKRLTIVHWCALAGVRPLNLSGARQATWIQCLAWPVAALIWS